MGIVRAVCTSVFARVIHGGRISCGDEMYMLGQGEQ